MNVYQNNWITLVLTMIDKADVKETPYIYKEISKISTTKSARSKIIHAIIGGNNMMLDTMEVNSLSAERMGLKEHLQTLHKGFESKLTAVDGRYQRVSPTIDSNIARMFGIADVETASLLSTPFMESAHQLLYGVEQNGVKTLGLDDIHKWNINKNYENQNRRQHAGYAAELISTYKENVLAKINHSDLTTYRADDLPELFPKNDHVETVVLMPKVR